MKLILRERTVVLGRDLELPPDVHDNEVSDGHHTFGELYAFREAMNALLFTQWARQGLYNVCKSRRHHSGELCFDDKGTHFIVVAELPTGQISWHYKVSTWDAWDIPEVELPPEWDGHTPEQALERLRGLWGLLNEDRV